MKCVLYTRSSEGRGDEETNRRKKSQKVKAGDGQTEKKKEKSQRRAVSKEQRGAGMKTGASAVVKGERRRR